MIIGLAGRMRTGKDTAAEYLVSNHGYKQVSLATPIKAAVAAITGIKDPEAYGRDTPIPYLNNKTHRYLWQTLGTEWGRCLVDEDIWLSLAHSTNKNIVISDIRFENEARYIRDNGGLLIHISRNTGLSSKHASEAGIEKEVSDVEIDNNFSLNTLYESIDKCLIKLNSQSSS